jgi:predicted MPP superfamily phosphohydrolase
MIIIPIVIWLLFELYVFKGVSNATLFITNNILRKGILLTYWAVPAFMLYQIFQLYIITKTPGYQSTPSAFSSFIGMVVLFIVPKLLVFGFHVIEDLVWVIKLIYQKLFIKVQTSDITNGGITRARFITQIGIVLAAIPFISILYGILFGRFNYTVVRKKLQFANLPESFQGLKVVHISDMHLGSFENNYNPIVKAVDMINELDADLILFTGDLVNNVASEVDGWEPILSKMKAKMGKFSITGNHDYGDYHRWVSDDEKTANFENFVQKHKDIDFRLMCNESLVFERGDDKLVLAGVENWGKPPFKQYGNLKQSLENVTKEDFTILMSHDPSHWDAEVITESDVDLTLSGHTHGMQFGIDIPGFKWSPIKYKYPRWSGLYEEGNQKLYVNRGFGYLAFPGRVGMPPEITLLEFEKA